MIEFRLRVLGETTSTNDDVKRALEVGEPEGLVVRARRQVSGYGRQGRAWTSPEGGLYQSLLLRPDVSVAALPTLSPLVSLAVRRALALLADDAYAGALMIKWPNDVVVSTATCSSPSQDSRVPYKKICGISLEVHAGGVCVGLGVNVRKPDADTSVGGKNVPAYLSDLGFSGSTDQVGSAVLEELALLYQQWKSHGFASLLAEYNAHSYLSGRTVRVENRTGRLVVEGIVQPVDAEGRLVVRARDGTLTPVSAGEAHLV